MGRKGRSLHDASLRVMSLVLLMGGVGFCQSDEQDTDLPIFKRNYSVLNFIDVNTYKEIDCSAENYEDITWYKDGLRFPFGWDEDKLQDMGISLDSRNQTLTLRRAETGTEGNYTCVVSNQNGSIRRDLELRVIANEWIHEPILAFDSHCGERITHIGSNITFTCKFFVGPNGDEAVASWYYEEKSQLEGKESQLPQGGHHHHLVWIYMRELNYTRYEVPNLWMDGKLLVVSLDIFNVTEPALGTYVLMVSNGIEPAAYHRITLSSRHRMPNGIGQFPIKGRQKIVP